MEAKLNMSNMQHQTLALGEIRVQKKQLKMMHFKLLCPSVALSSSSKRQHRLLLMRKKKERRRRSVRRKKRRQHVHRTERVRRGCLRQQHGLIELKSLS